MKDKKLFWKVSRQPHRPEAVARDHSQERRYRRSAGPQDHQVRLSRNSKGQNRARRSGPNDLEGAYVAADVVDMSTGEILVEANHELTATAVSRLIDAGITSFEVFFPERDDAGNVISVTLRKDPVKTQNDALLEIYRKLRPGDPPTLDTATQLFQGMFFDPRKYDFSRVGRMKFNIKLYDKIDESPLDKRTLDQKDFTDTIIYLLQLAQRSRGGGRHRSPRQPPRPRRGRTA